MNNGLKTICCAAAFLSILPISIPAMAGNRAFDAFSAVLDDPSSASCFNHMAGDPVLTNNCGTSKSVFLPMSVEAAGAWYTVSVYGRGLIDGNNQHHTIWCVANTIPHNYSGALWGTSWQQLPNDASFGGDQTLVVGATPVYASGDAAYAYCVMDSQTKIFSYGWN